tara:strand:- start:1892 stop:2149 length:258 start_codon:yes stop_codon:yes gene_type:complete
MTDNTLQANRILIFIEQPTLNNIEEGDLTTGDGLELVLKSLSLILDDRKDSAGAMRKLNAYALAKNITLTATKTFKSNVFIGAAL